MRAVLERRGREFEMLRLTVRYARYALAVLSVIGFELFQN